MYRPGYWPTSDGVIPWRLAWHYWRGARTWGSLAQLQQAEAWVLAQGGAQASIAAVRDRKVKEAVGG